MRGQVIAGRDNGGLKNVEINLGHLCNNKCVFCLSAKDRDDRQDWSGLGRVRSEITARYTEGARSIGFLGGEPTVYPHILDCLRLAKSLGYLRITLCTNGVRLAQAKFLEQALEAGLSRVTVSLHSADPRIEESLVGVPGVFEKKLQAIKNLVRVRDAGRLPDGLSLNPVLCRPNSAGILSYARFFAALGILDIRFNFIWPQEQVEHDRAIVPRYREVMPYILDLTLQNERALKMSLSFGSVPYCVVPRPLQRRWTFLEKYFYEEGMDLPTQVSSLGWDGKGRVERFDWQEKLRTDYKAKMAVCMSCRFNGVCMGVYKTYLSLYGESEFRPEDKAR